MWSHEPESAVIVCRWVRSEKPGSKYAIPMTFSISTRSLTIDNACVLVEELRLHHGKESAVSFARLAVAVLRDGVRGSLQPSNS